MGVVIFSPCSSAPAREGWHDEGSDKDEDIMEQDDSDFESSGEEEDEELDESDSEPSAKVVLLEQSAMFALLWSSFQIHHLDYL